MGSTPISRAARWNSTKPCVPPTSVRATASKPMRRAWRHTSAGAERPWPRLYEESTRRCTNGLTLRVDMIPFLVPPRVSLVGPPPRQAAG